MDTELDRIVMEVTPGRSSSAKRSVFGSIERGVDRLKNMLTPKKRALHQQDAPRKVKVSNTAAAHARNHVISSKTSRDFSLFVSRPHTMCRTRVNTAPTTSYIDCERFCMKSKKSFASPTNKLGKLAL